MPAPRKIPLHSRGCVARMNKYWFSFGGVIVACLLLAGCVTNESPQSSLTVSNGSTANAQAADLNYANADLPMQGPAPETRPDILSLASGSTSISQDANKPSSQDVLQAMVEPDKKTEILEPAAVSTPKAQPVVASNRERDCLMRAMYFESNRSSPDGLLSVGTVVMHRLENGAWGKSICGVVGAPRQFAPGALSRRMEGNLTDLQALADQIIAGKRQPKLAKNVMFFHVAGMKFPYKNMRYVHVAGGNTFYYKASRKRRA
jgi:spore germination cell wall hydrolase CwlJ-like protein/outer membrane murein-binding lipoprotein Lpp